VPADGFHPCRFVPVAAYAVAILKAKFHFGNLAKDMARRTEHLARRIVPRVAAMWQRVTRCIGRKAQRQPDEREMTPQRIVDSGGLL
jgi:hypothetical protein